MLSFSEGCSNISLVFTMAIWINGESKRKKVSVKIFLVFFYLMALTPLSCTVAAETRISPQKLEVQKLLKQLNKPAVKSIKSPDGDIIDCVRVSHQPAFDHPLLKNHTIQMKPKIYTVSHSEENNNATTKSKQSSDSITQLWHLSGERCPEGTIPIRRTKEDDILRASSVQRFGKKQQGTIPQPRYENPDVTSSVHEYAVAYTAGAKYYGAQAIINLWKPNIQQPNEFSLSQFWIGGGSKENINTIEAGWQAYPNLYGDYNPRLFIYWTSDGYHTTGCYNLHCSGFIQVNNQIAMGGSLSPISAYGGSQYAINILVWKDPGSGNWWMRFGNSYVGYWPSSLFSDLDKSASFVEWGGEIINSKSNGQHTSTNMGSGHFPREGFSKASFFKNIQVVDGSNYLIDPNGIGTIVTQSNCYDIQTGSSGSWGNYFFYGGSGRNNNCP